MSSSRTNALHPSVGQIDSATGSKGNDRLLLGIIMGVSAFWLFAQTTLNIAPDMQKDLALDTGLMNTAVAITALFSGIFIVFRRPDRSRENRDGRLGACSNIGSLLIGFAPPGALASSLLPLRAQPAERQNQPWDQSLAVADLVTGPGSKKLTGAKLPQSVTGD